MAATLTEPQIEARRKGARTLNSPQSFHLDDKQALELIASGDVPVADLITHRLPLEQTIEGIHTVTRGEAIKATIEA